MVHFNAFLSVQTSLCACLQCVVAVCYFRTFPKCCEEKDRDCPAGTLKAIQPIFAFLLQRRTKLNIYINWYQLWPQWLNYYCGTHSSRLFVGCISFFLYGFVRSFECLFVCSVFLCQSVPKHKHRHVFLCHLNPVINNLVWLLRDELSH